MSKMKKMVSVAVLGSAIMWAVPSQAAGAICACINGHCACIVWN